MSRARKTQLQFTTTTQLTAVSRLPVLPCRFFNGTPSNCFPCATGLASSFDVELAHEIGVQLGKECAVKGAHILLGPTMNIQRSPLGGRGFESFSEDPVLSGNMASEYIKGVQSKGVAATPKHFVSLMPDEAKETAAADAALQ